MQVRESSNEKEPKAKLGELKYTLRRDIRDRTTLDDFLAVCPFNNAELAGKGGLGQEATAEQSSVTQSEAMPAAQAEQGR